MTIREKLILAGVKSLMESYPGCNKENITTDIVYKKAFIHVLKEWIGSNDTVNNEIVKLVEECRLPTTNCTKRYRTAFPNSINFSGWWVISKKNCVARLIKCGQNLHEHILYVLQFSNGQTGGQRFTMAELMEHGTMFIVPKREDLPINDESKVH